jgi:hypothetical protein
MMILKVTQFLKGH